jgi:SAM-dependent methyltransferase
MLGLPQSFRVALCERCGLAFTEPPLTDAELAPHYDGYAPHGSRPSRLRDLHAAARFLAGPFRTLLQLPPGRALDVGCGHGQLGAWLLAHGWTVDGVEPSVEAARRARARGVGVRCASLDAATLEPASYDVLVFNHSLEHLPDPRRALRTAHLLLRSGGRIIVVAPDFDSWQRRLFGTFWFHLDLPRHRIHFNAQSLAARLREASFRGVRVRDSLTAIGLWGSLQYAIAGHCVFRGRARTLAIALADLAYPLLLPAALLGGDVLVATAER